MRSLGPVAVFCLHDERVGAATVIMRTSGSGVPARARDTRLVVNTVTVEYGRRDLTGGGQDTWVTVRLVGDHTCDDEH